MDAFEIFTMASGKSWCGSFTMSMASPCINDMKTVTVMKTMMTTATEATILIVAADGLYLVGSAAV